MKNKNPELINKQQRRILISAKKCFLKNGLAHTTMRDIASDADMSLGNIYRYFKNKEVLIQAFIESDNQEIGEAFSLLNNTKNFSKTLYQIGKAFIDELSVKSELLLYFDIMSEALRNEKILQLIELGKSEQLLKESLQKAADEKRIIITLPPENTALAIISYIENSALKCIIDKKYSSRLANKQLKAYLAALIQNN